MSAMSEECKLSFYEEIASLREDRQFWLVRQKQTGKFYVKKKLSTSNREVYRALQAIDSRNLPRIYECISLGEELIVIEELINGDTLTDLMQREKISPGRAALIMMDICDVLCILHAMKPPVIHRDIKPGNIMISNDGVVKLMDFDIARTYDEDRTCDTEHMGTVGYAAPEHFGFGQTDARSDIYSCGVVLNELLTGEMPEEKLAGGALGGVVEKCIQVDPIHRYQNASELREALKESVGMGEASAPGRNWRKFLPPGFRGLRLWKMAVATVVYGFLLNAFAMGNFKSSSEGELIATRLLSGLGALGGILVLFNYLGVADRLPGAKRFHGWASWLLRFAYAVAVFFLGICILVVLLDFTQ